MASQSLQHAAQVQPSLCSVFFFLRSVLAMRGAAYGWPPPPTLGRRRGFAVAIAMAVAGPRLGHLQDMDSHLQSTYPPPHSGPAEGPATYSIIKPRGKKKKKKIDVSEVSRPLPAPSSAQRSLSVLVPWGVRVRRCEIRDRVASDGCVRFTHPTHHSRDFRFICFYFMFTTQKIRRGGGKKLV